MAVQDPSPWVTGNLRARWQARVARDKGHQGLLPGEEGALSFVGRREGWQGRQVEKGKFLPGILLCLKKSTKKITKIQGSTSFVPFQGELHGRAAPAHTVITCSAQKRSEALGFNCHFKRGASVGKGSFPTASLGTAQLDSQRHLLVGCLFKGFCV